MLSVVCLVILITVLGSSFLLSSLVPNGTAVLTDPLPGVRLQAERFLARANSLEKLGFGFHRGTEKAPGPSIPGPALAKLQSEPPTLSRARTSMKRAGVQGFPRPQKNLCPTEPEITAPREPQNHCPGELPGEHAGTHPQAHIRLSHSKWILRLSLALWIEWPL